MKIKQKAYLPQHKQQSPENNQNQSINKGKSSSPHKITSSAKPGSPSPEQIKKYLDSYRKKQPVAATICKRIAQRERNYLYLIESSQDKQQMGWIANLSSEINERRTTFTNLEQTLRSERNCQRNSEWDLQMYEKSYTPSQLDYVRIIREKQQTIKQLREILQQMDKNSIINHPVDDQKLKRAQRSIKECHKQIKVLQIENQCLINVIQSNHVNIPSNKEAILQREIAQLRESLKLKDEEVEHTRHCSQSASHKILHLEVSNKQLLQLNQQLQVQCQKLVKLMKEKNGLQKPKNEFGGYSELKRGEKMTLNLIKNQYSQNLVLMKQNFQAEVQKLSQIHQQNLYTANNKIDHLLRKVKAFEERKQLLTKRVDQVSSSKKLEKKQECLEIQFLLQKFQMTEKDLQNQKSINSRLSNQLQLVQRTLRSFQIRSFQASQSFERSDRIINEKEARILNQTEKQLRTQMIKLKEENENLKRKITEIEGKRENQQKSFQKKLETVVICYENQLKDRRSSIDENIRDLQQNYIDQLYNLKASRQQVQKQNNQLKKQKEYWSSQYKKISELFEEGLKAKSLLINQQLKFKEIDSSIITELSQLKKDIGFLNDKILKQNQTLSHYECLKAELQLKIQQNHMLSIEIENLRQDINNHQLKEKLLSQRMVGLQKAISLQDQAARERRLIYQQLFIDKTKLQKQTILAQKLKLVNKNSETNKQPFKLILNFIERLQSTEKESKLKFSCNQQL